MSEPHPDLDAIKPGVKIAVNEEESRKFDVLSTSQNCPVTLETRDDGRVSYVRHAMSKEECENLCKVMDNSDHLSFWNDQGRGNEKARQFRDADTIEVNLPSLASTLWSRIYDVFDKTPIVIRHDDTEHTNPQWERELPGEWIPCGVNHNFLFARYPEGGHFAPHTDGRVIHDFNTRSFRSVILFLNDIPLEEGGGGTRFYSKEALKHLKQNDKGQWTCESDALGSLVTIEISAESGKMLTFDQTLVHEGMSCKGQHCKYIIRSDIMYERIPPILNTEKDKEAYTIFREAEDLADSGDVDQSIVLFRRAFKMSPELAAIMGS